MRKALSDEMVKRLQEEVNNDDKDDRMDDENKRIKITVEKVTKFNYFWHGAVFYGAIISLYQDIIGKEAYINNCQNRWVDGSITIPIAIGMMFLIFIDIIRKVRSGA